mmetsp:Transcript_27309/g.109379  ORF Transcript_27309/g.109379 Transcript_27309/m.109379 type:complete len:215 (+) Transcript_27309:248-892(+)
MAVAHWRAASTVAKETRTPSARTSASRHRPYRVHSRPTSVSSVSSSAGVSGCDERFLRRTLGASSGAKRRRFVGAVLWSSAPGAPPTPEGAFDDARADDEASPSAAVASAARSSWVGPRRARFCVTEASCWRNSACCAWITYDPRPPWSMALPSSASTASAATSRNLRASKTTVASPLGMPPASRYTLMRLILPRPRQMSSIWIWPIVVGRFDR